MSFFSKYQTLIVVLVLVVAGFFAYSYFFTGPAAPILSSSAPSTSTSAVDQNLITLLSTLNSIKLDPSIFSDPAFESLQDFSQALVPEPVGRENPFAPLSGTSNTTGSNSTSANSSSQ